MEAGRKLERALQEQMQDQDWGVQSRGLETCYAKVYNECPLRSLIEDFLEACGYRQDDELYVTEVIQETHYRGMIQALKGGYINRDDLPYIACLCGIAKEIILADRQRA